jgi:hypothetical protein
MIQVATGVCPRVRCPAGGAMMISRDEEGRTDAQW